jgi:hypothetical protein
MKPRMASLAGFAASAFVAFGLTPHLGSFARRPVPASDPATVAQEDPSVALPGSGDGTGVSNQDDTDMQPGAIQNNNGLDGSDAGVDNAQQPDDSESVPPPQSSMQQPDDNDSGDASAQQQQSDDNGEQESQPSAGDEN